MVRLVKWNGKDVPEELRQLPAGRYVLVSADDAPALTAEEDAGLRLAMESLKAGKGRDLESVKGSLKKFL